MTSLLAELKRRNVFRVALAYIVVGWVVLQVAEFLSPLLQLPDWTVSLALYIGILGFPFALLFAWAFEMTPQGLRLTEHVHPEESITSDTGKTLNRTIIGLMGVAILLLLAERFYTRDLNVEAESTGEQQAATTAASTDEAAKSIAVLPFVNMSNDVEQEYFSDGISEELLNGLAKISDLRVAARTSSFAFKGQNTDITEIGKQLKVGTVLEGSVRKSGTRLRITAQLIDVEDGYHLWSDTYDRELTDIFAIQDEISAAIVQALKVHLTDGESAPEVQARNIEAYNFYLLAQHNLRLRNEVALQLAIKQYQQALDYDPSYAAAQAGQALATNLLSLRHYGSKAPRVANREAQQLLDRAFALDPDLGEAHAIQGLLYLDNYRLDEAETSLRKAISQNPSEGIVYSWLSNVVWGRGNYRESVATLEKAFEIDPLHNAIRNNVVMIQVDTGRMGLAREMVTPDTEMAYATEAMIARRRGDYAEMRQFSDKAIAKAGEGRLSRSRFMRGWRTLYLLGDVDQSIDDIPTSMATAASAIINPEDGYQQLRALPKTDQDKWYEWGLAWNAMARGDHELAIQLLDEYVDPEGPVYGESGAALVHLELAAMYACSLDALGQEKQARHLAGLIEAFVARANANGEPPGFYEAYLAQAQVVLDKPEAAVTSLKQALSYYQISWIEFAAPCLAPLHQREDFRELQSAVYKHMNAERAKLDWPPVEVPSA